MIKIIFGIVFIIGGLSGQLVLRGTHSSTALVIAGVVMVIIGIVQLVSKNEEEEVAGEPLQVAEWEVKGEKLPIYTKAHESFGTIAELNSGDKVQIDFRSDFGRFYQVKLNSGETGYILRESVNQ